jgi:hypothetical protein
VIGPKDAHVSVSSLRYEQLTELFSRAGGYIACDGSVSRRTPRCVDAEDRMIVMSEGDVKIMMSSAG